MRPIDADALFKTINRRFYNALEVGSKESQSGRFRRGYNVAITDACEDITNAPTISPDEVRGVGEWIKYAPHNSDMLVCSVCEKYWILDGDQYDFRYCPNCGARMEVQDEQTD